MALDASALLGSHQIAGVRVQHMGQFKRDVASLPASGLAGTALVGGAGEIGARIVAGRSQAVPAQTPEFERKQVFLAITDKELALVNTKIGGWSVKLTEVLTRIPRGDVVSAEVGRGPAPPLTITLADGEIWQFEIPNPGFLAAVPALNTRAAARRIAALLSGASEGA